MYIIYIYIYFIYIYIYIIYISTLKPYTKSVNAEMGKFFLQLLAKHSPKERKLCKILNRNTLKLSYSFITNIKNTYKRT